MNSNAGRKRTILIGGGGHASDILAAYEASACTTGIPHPVVGILDDGEIDCRRFAGRGVVRLGGISDLESIEPSHLMLAVGSPQVRCELWLRLKDLGVLPDIIVHPRAFLPPRVTVGEGTVVLANAVVSELATIGAHAYLSHGTLVGHDTRLGSFASIMPGAVISGDVTIGDGVMIGSNASVLNGLSVGDGAVVGAGAVVIRDVPPGATVVGNPAKIVCKAG